MTTTQQQPNDLIREEDERIVRLIKRGMLLVAFGAAATVFVTPINGFSIGAFALAATNYAAISAIEALDASNQEKEQQPHFRARWKKALLHPFQKPITVQRPARHRRGNGSRVGNAKRQPQP